MTEGRLRQEITEWDKCNYDQKNHIYITKGSYLIGYIPFGSKEAQYFSAPKKQWSVSRRKFRNLTKKESRDYVF